MHHFLLWFNLVLILLHSTTLVSGKNYEDITPYKALTDLTIYIEIKEEIYGKFLIQHYHEDAGNFITFQTDPYMLNRANHRVSFNQYTITDTLNLKFFEYKYQTDEWLPGSYSIKVFLIDSLGSETERNTILLKNVSYQHNPESKVSFKSSIQNNSLHLQSKNSGIKSEDVSCTCTVTSFKSTGKNKFGTEALQPDMTHKISISPGDSIELFSYIQSNPDAYKHYHECFFNGWKIDESEAQLTILNESFNNTPFIFDYSDNIISKRYDFNGYAQSTSFYQSYNNAYDPRPEFYNQLTISPTISIYGIPFNTNISLHSDQYSSLHQNEINFQFDHSQFMRNKNNLQNDYNYEYQNHVNIQKKELAGLEFLKYELESEINRISFESDINNDFVNSSDYDSLNSKSEVQTPELNNLSDSLRRINLLLEQKKSINKLDSLSLSQSKLQNTLPDIELPYNRRTESFFTNLKTFSVGTSYPSFSPLTIDGSPVQGLNSSFENENVFISLAGGKSASPFQFSTFPQNSYKIDYNRNLVATQIGYGSRNGSYIAVNLANINDQSNSHPLIENNNNITNRVYSFAGQWQLSNYLKFSGEVAKTDLVGNETFNINTSQNNVSHNSAHENKAYLGEIQSSPIENGTLILKYRYIHATYLSYGAPFIVPDQQKIKASYRHQMFKNRINMEAFYMHVKDNTLKTNENFNELSGYGFSGNTAFSNYPNLFISYSPYEQSNNHYDPLLYSHSKYSVLTSLVYYNFKIGSSFSQLTINYQQSNMQYSENDFVSFQQMGIEHYMSLNQNLSFSNSAQIHKTVPHIDSNNVLFLTSAAQYNVTSNTSVQGGMEFREYDHGGLYYEIFIGTGFGLLNSLRASFRFGTGRINRLWGYNNYILTTGRASLTYVW